nr:hypothetical protein [Tanacetum cinerariifolium]
MPHDLPLPRVDTHGSDEGRMQHKELMDLVTKLTDRVLPLKTNLQQTKKVYSTAVTKLVMKEIEFESKDISTTETLMYIRRSASKDKDTQATIEANEELALRLQAEEREKYSEAKKARLLVDLIRSHTLQQLKRLSFDVLKNLSEAKMKRVKTFTPVESDVYRTILKIANESLKGLHKKNLNKKVLRGKDWRKLITKRKRR